MKPQSPYKANCPIDKMAAPFYGGKKSGGEVKRAGAHGDIVRASHHSKRGGGGGKRSGY